MERVGLIVGGETEKTAEYCMEGLVKGLRSAYYTFNKPL